VIAATVYLSSSRGGVAVAVVGALAFAGLSGRVRALQALAVGGAGAAAAIAVLAARPVLVDGPLGTSHAESEGIGAALLILAICLACAVVHAALSALASERLRVPRAVWAVLAIVIVAGAVAANPGARIDEFKAPPPDQGPAAGAVAIDSHLASGSGSGRWQFWSAALDQFSDSPVTGGGAGSYEPWWAQHGTLNWFVRNAHSLWLETLGELGVLGLLLIAGAFALALGAGVSRLRRAEGSERTTIAALVAVVVAFAVGSALDWVWQLPAVAALALLAMGLLVGPATAGGVAPGAAEGPAPGLRFGVRAAIVLAAWVVLCSQAIPYLSSKEVEASQRAARAGDLAEALEKAHSAETIEPWASTPRLQLALVHEEAGQIDLARSDVAAAIERSSEDWRLQIVASRLALKDADVPAARRFLARARSLNPRSRLLRAAGTK
jgi:O-antigen ligase